MLKRELGILRTLDHPNVTRFYETYEDVRYVHFVMEYCSGGDMLDNILVKSINLSIIIRVFYREGGLECNGYSIQCYKLPPFQGDNPQRH